MLQKTSNRRQTLLAGKQPLMLGPGHHIRQKLDRGRTYLFTGAADMLLLEGRLSAAGKMIRPAERLRVPEKRALPVEAQSESFIRLSFGTNGSLSLLAKSTIPADWDLFVARAIAAQKKAILVLGETDTGKTFFVTYLANKIAGAGRTVAVVNCDPGQPAIGPPATVGFAVLDGGACFLDTLQPRGLGFTGAYSPSAGFLEFGVAVTRVLREARAAAEVLVINAPGWVQGDGGRLLSRSEVEIFAADSVALLERGNELRYIAQVYPRLIGYLTVPEAVVPRSTGERKTVREETARSYFNAARNIELPFREIATDRCYLLSGKKMRKGALNTRLDSSPVVWAERLGSREGILLVARRPLLPDEIRRVRAAHKNARVRVIVAGDERDLEVALNDESNRVLALGLIQKIHFSAERFRIYTPLPARQRKAVRIIQFGFLKLSRDGVEAGTVDPGYF